MKKNIYPIIFIFLTSCASMKKCPNKESANTVVEPNSCQVLIKNAYYAEQLSSDVKDGIQKGGQVQFVWIETKQTGEVVIPAHFELKVSKGDE